MHRTWRSCFKSYVALRGLVYHYVEVLGHEKFVCRYGTRNTFSVIDKDTGGEEPAGMASKVVLVLLESVNFMMSFLQFMYSEENSHTCSVRSLKHI